MEETIEGKVVLLGESGVGKTSLVLRYCTGSFSRSTSSTVGATFLTKSLFVDGRKVKLQIWDTAGQERFRSMAPMYYRYASVAIITFDVTNEYSFTAVRRWAEELRKNVGDVYVCIAGNKMDLNDLRKVDSHEMKEYANSIRALCFDTSAKTGDGVEDMFVQIARELISKKTVEEMEVKRGRRRPRKETITIDSSRKLRSSQSSSSSSTSSCCGGGKN